MTDQELKQLEQSIREILQIADNYGLDYFPMRYEVCPADIIYTIAAYGMPTRFSHWSFGKSFHRMKLQYDFNLNRIYELVINTDPCYAFLLDGNTLIQNKLVSAHVLGHSDFFKNNYRFRNTSRDMIERMSIAAERIRSYEIEFGIGQVEEFLDAVIAVQEHIDPSISFSQKKSGLTGVNDGKKQELSKAGCYDDLWELDQDISSMSKIVSDATGKEREPRQNHSRKISINEINEKDILLFIMENSKILEPWQRDIISILRDEMLYFWPQLETKIMNEGWASYWHIKIMRELSLPGDEAIEFAKLNAEVIQPSKTSINPYYLGLKIFEDIADKYGEEAIFDVRELDSDQSFLRNYLTKELVEKLDLYVFAKVGLQWKVVDKNWESIRDTLVQSKTNGGFPVIIVKDSDYQMNGELYLEHQYEGMELDIKYLEKTMPYVYRLWGRTVHLHSLMEGRNVVFTYDGKKSHRRFV